MGLGDLRGGSERTGGMRRLLPIGLLALAIQLTTAVEHPVRALHTFAWPPQIKAAQVRAGFEGLPGRIGVYQASSLIGRREISLFVWFGRSRPPVRQVSLANIELRRAR